MINEEKLDGWEKTTLGNIADYINGRAFKPTEWQSTGIPIIRIQNLNKPTASYNYYKGELEEKYKVKNGDLLYSWSASLDSYIWSEEDAYLNQHIFNVKPYGDIRKKFIYYLLKQISSEILSKTHGMGMVHITKGNFEKIEVLIPPLNEQDRIIDKIEVLHSEIDSGIDNLTLAKRQLEQYRQSLLKNAFEGKLTAKWREEYAEKHGELLPNGDELLEQIQTARQDYYNQQITDWEQSVEAWEEQGKEGSKPRKPSAIKTISIREDELSSLPSSWSHAKVGQIADVMTGSTPLKSNADYYDNGTIPWITSGSLNNEYVSDTNNYVTELAVEETNLKLFPKHTLLVAMYGEGKTRGKCSELLFESTTNQAIAGLIVNDDFEITRKYLKLFMLKNYDEVRRKSSGGVQPNLNLSLISNIIFPLPPIQEQEKIIQTVISNLEYQANIQREIDINLKKSHLLKTSILHKAFQGKLVHQDPNDPPARELLAQIKAEREAKALAEKQAKQDKAASKSKAKAKSSKTPKKSKKDEQITLPL